MSVLAQMKLGYHSRCKKGVCIYESSKVKWKKGVCIYMNAPKQNTTSHPKVGKK
jgi:hypothetical protein